MPPCFTIGGRSSSLQVTTSGRILGNPELLAPLWSPSLILKKVKPFHCPTPGTGWLPKPQWSQCTCRVQGRPPVQCHITVVLSGSKSSHLTGVLVCTGWYSLDRSPPWTLTHHPPVKLRQRSLLPVGKLWNSASSHGPLHDPAAMAPRTAQRRGTIGEPVRLQSEVGSVGLAGPGSFSLGLFSCSCAGLDLVFSSTGLAIDASPS